MPCGSYDPVDSMLHEVALANMHVVCILLQFLIGESQYRNLGFRENHAIFYGYLSSFSKPTFGLLLGLGTE
jgi:hypothetical protein